MTYGELTYHPVGADIEFLAHDRRVDRVLVVGLDVPDHLTSAQRLRVLGEPSVRLPEGLYTFESGGLTDLMWIQEGTAPGSPQEARWDAPDEHPLVQAYGWLTEWWEGASEVPKPAFQVGAHVQLKSGGEEAIVRSRQFDDGAWWYRVRVDGRSVRLAEGALLHPDLDDEPEDWIRRSPARSDQLAATLTRAKLREELTDTVYSFRATRTTFRPYQFRPVMRLLGTGSLRLLIADEVGLGKTIEAGLIWTELDARKQANRVLVVCPSMLVPKWRAEMQERFGYELIDLDRPALTDMLERLETDRLPARFHAISSLERLRVWDGLERLAELSPRFDLVIVDEAHALRNAGTRSYALGALLSEMADALIFLSATPLNLGNDDLYNLLQLLAPGEFDDRTTLEHRLAPNGVLNRVSASFFDPNVTNHQRLLWLGELDNLTFGVSVTGRPEYSELVELLESDQLTPREIADAKRLIERLHALSAVVTRTRKVEVQDQKAVREAHAIDVTLSHPEARFYLAFEAWQRERARRKGLPVGFATQMPLRLASSCIPAARAKVLEWSASAWRDEDLETGDEVEVPLIEDELDGPPPELVELARNLGDVDTKFDMFLPVLRRVIAEGHRSLLFTFSRQTLAYLEERLRPHVRLAVMHGGVGRDERHGLMRRFRNGEYDLMIASRVASEGLDFEFCGAIFNWDLPWNPMEVEQRIGRIDRFGQLNEKILVFNFHTPGTIETDIIERVHQRIGVFESSIGELEPIIQSKLAELEKVIFDFSLSDEQRERRQNEILTAIEEQALTLEDLESARNVLASADQAEIDGLEEDLVSTGRYVGQEELVLLISEWAARAGGHCVVSPDRTVLTVVGSPTMEGHLRGVVSAGERSQAELELLARDLRDGRDIHVYLDQELARITGGDLLNANHPLIRAALRSPGTDRSRMAVVRCNVPGVEAGDYLVLLTIARWTGAQPSREFWTTVVDLESLREGPAEVGDALLRTLAEAALVDGGPPPSPELLGRALRQAERQLSRRQGAEQEAREAMNTALIETRRISLREIHDRKVAQIRQRIATLRASGNTAIVRLHESQLGKQEERLREAEEELESRRGGRLEVEPVAVCVVRVGGVR